MCSIFIEMLIHIPACAILKPVMLLTRGCRGFNVETVAVQATM